MNNFFAELDTSFQTLEERLLDFLVQFTNGSKYKTTLGLKSTINIFFITFLDNEQTMNQALICGACWFPHSHHD